MKQDSPRRHGLVRFRGHANHRRRRADGAVGTILIGAALGTALALCAGAGYLAQQPAQAEARMLLGTVAPPPALGQAGLPDFGRSERSLTMLAERTLGGGRSNQRFERLRQLLTGRHAARAVRSRPEMAAALFPQRRRAGEPGWHAPRGVSGRLRAWLAPLAGGRSDWRPTTREIERALADRLAFAEKREAGLMGIHLRHADPARARRLLATVRQAAGQRLHDLADERTRQATADLKGRLAEASDARRRDALAGLLRQYELARIQLTGPDGYAARTIEPPAASAYPRYPQPVVVLGGSALAGLLLGGGAGAGLNRRRDRAAKPA